ncbi:MAG: hypothetical protein ACLRZS_13120 [Mediterraneibacter gnavus]
MLLIMVCILGVFVCILLYCGLAASKNAEAQWKELERKVYEKRKKKNKSLRTNRWQQSRQWRNLLGMLGCFGGMTVWGYFGSEEWMGTSIICVLLGGSGLYFCYKILLPSTKNNGNSKS